MSKFQIILLSIFGVFIIGAVILFSVSRGSSKQNVSLTAWGTIPAASFNLLIGAVGLDKTGIVLNYVEKSAASFDADFTEALAESKGPDLVLISDQNLWRERSKLTLVTFSAISQKDFTATFVEEGNLFVQDGGFYALPLFVDPMVMYVNRDLLDSAALAEPLHYWDEIYNYANKLTHKDPAGNVTQSTMALGESGNIPHAKDILALLMLQAGTPITDFVSGGLQSEMLNNFGLPLIPADSALDFYTQFSNPAKPFYDWNRSLPSAEVNFYSGDTAFYLGFASENNSLRAKNPNVSIGVVPVPQSRASGKTLTLAHIYGLALVKNSPKQSAALSAALSLVSSTGAATLAKYTNLPPARRDLLSVKQADGVQAIFYDAAIQARGWLDPSPDKSNAVFGNLIDSVTSGRAAIDSALNAANNSLNNLIHTP